MTIDDALSWADQYQNGFEDDPVVVLAAEVRRLQAESENLRQNAARYTRLRAKCKTKQGRIQMQGIIWNMNSRKDLDAALDRLPDGE